MPSEEETSQHLATAFYLSFLADGRVVTVTTLAYGDTFTPDMLPPVPEKEGYVGEWEDFDYHTITFDQTVNAVYTEYVTAIESAQALGQRPHRQGSRAVYTAKNEICFFRSK